MASPSYRERLTLEGGVLAASGLVGSAALLAFIEGSGENPLSTGGQLAVVVGLCAWLGPRSARRWTDRAESIGEGEASRVSGDPQRGVEQVGRWQRDGDRQSGRDRG